MLLGDVQVVEPVLRTPHGLLEAPRITADGGLVGSGSVAPAPGRSNMIKRLNDASRPLNAALGSQSQTESTGKNQEPLQTRSTGPSPTTW